MTERVQWIDEINALIDEYIEKEMSLHDLAAVYLLPISRQYYPFFTAARQRFDHLAEQLRSEDFSAYASGKDEDRYLGFRFGDGGLVVINNESVLIEREAAIEYLEAFRRAEAEKTGQAGAGGSEIGTGTGTGSTTGTGTGTGTGSGDEGGSTDPVQLPKNFFHGTIDLDPVRAKMDFVNVVDEIIQQFTSKIGVDVRITVDIESTAQEGLDEALQRTIKENGNVLQFSNAEFESN